MIWDGESDDGDDCGGGDLGDDSGGDEHDDGYDCGGGGDMTELDNDGDCLWRVLLRNYEIGKDSFGFKSSALELQSWGTKPFRSNCQRNCPESLLKFCQENSYNFRPPLL